MLQKNSCKCHSWAESIVLWIDIAKNFQLLFHIHGWLIWTENSWKNEFWYPTLHICWSSVLAKHSWQAAAAENYSCLCTNYCMFCLIFCSRAWHKVIKFVDAPTESIVLHTYQEDSLLSFILKKAILCSLTGQDLYMYHTYYLLAVRYATNTEKLAKPESQVNFLSKSNTLWMIISRGQEIQMMIESYLYSDTIQLSKWL